MRQRPNTTMLEIARLQKQGLSPRDIAGLSLRELAARLGYRTETEQPSERSKLTKTKLRERGWTDGLIDALLPAPEVHSRYQGGEYYLWDEEVVLRAEDRDEWLEAQRKRKMKSAKL